MLMWLAVFLPVVLIPPRLLDWRPRWLGSIIAFFLTTIASGIAGLVLAYVLSDLTGAMPLGQAFARAIGTWGIAVIVSFVICVLAAFRRR